MSFLDNFGNIVSGKIEKVKNPEESEALIKEYLKEYEELFDFKNHKKYSLGSRENIYRFTVKLLSLEFLGSMAKDKRVKNVMFSPSTPPPGAGIDSISMRYKVYVEYH